MRHLIPALLVGLSLGASTPLQAQQATWLDQLLLSARLPVETWEARREGVGSEEIRSVLDALRRAKVPAYEATAVIDTARAVRREHGPVDNFGAFVQTQLASGKRGRELAAAIRAEHARAGKGNAARGTTSGDDRGRRDDKATGRSDNRGDTARGRGRPDSQPGRPAAQGKKPDDRGRGRNPAKPNP